MAPSLLVLLLCAGLVGETYGNLLQFRKMVKNVMGGSPLMNYGFYGCYCGLGGSGWPVDKIDWCCNAHDCCYTKVSRTDPDCYPKLINYSFDFANRDLTCVKEQSECARKVCECDREITLCFKKYNATYSEKNNNYDKRNKCKGLEPNC